ncbi:MAG TPA: GyrI-like domain-containing protein [Aggregatilineales bacterium]|nr:GyrI-like domain-containing protein [Aggregatilineales bacterium]
MPTKLDLKKDLKHLYNPSAKEVVLMDVPPMNFLMVDGHGDPNESQPFQEAMEALYAVAYTLKFASKAGGIDYTVMPPEGLWWMDDMREFSMAAKDRWQWTLMIMQPDHITAEMVRQAVEDIQEKKNPPALEKLRFERFHEGLAAQIMHIGPYDAEEPTIARIHAWITAHGYDFHGAGKHHEIYLGDPRRTAPDKLKTVLRQPVIQPQA